MAARQVELHTELPDLKSLYRGLSCAQSHIPSSGPNNTLLSQGSVLGQLLPWELKQNMHSKVGGEELLIAWDQLRGQLAVTAS